MLKSLSCLLVLALVAVGCFSRPDVDVEPSKTASSKTAGTKPPAKKKPVITRTTLEGNWVIQFNQFMDGGYSSMYVTAGLIQVERNPKSKVLTAKLLSSPVKDLEILQQSLTDQTLALILKSKSSQQQDVFDLKITLQGSESIGTAALMGQIQPARLVATDDVNVTKWLEPVEHEHIEAFRKAMHEFGTLKKAESAEKFVTKYPKSPLAYIVVLSLDPIRIPDSKPTEQQLRHYRTLQRNTLAHWGDRAYLISQLLHLSEVARRGIFPDYNLSDIEAVASSDKPFPLSDNYRSQLENLKVIVSCDVAMTTKDPVKRATAVTLLEKSLQHSNRYNVQQLYALAVASEQTKTLDAAIDRLGTLVALPSLTIELDAFLKQRGQKPPKLKEQLEALWTKKHGSVKGVQDFLKAKYEQAIADLVAELPVTAKKPVTGKRRVQLCELFTVNDNPFCTSADISVAAIRRAYSRDDLIVLTYALDDPKPGPLVCSDSKNRAFDVQAVKPPRIHINGFAAVKIDGTMSRVPHVHRFLNDIIAQFPTVIDKKLGCTLTLSANRSGEVVTITANAEVAKEHAADLRLRVVIAEDHIDYTGGNGVTRHEMVVRSMPSGIDGVPFKEGKVAWKHTVDLKQVRRQLLDFLTSYEERLEIKLPVKPVDLKNIHVVAFIQDKRTMQIITAASVHLAAPRNTPPGPAKPR